MIRNFLPRPPFGTEKIVVNNSERSLTFSRKDGNFFAGQKVLVTLTKLENGDILVHETRKGWAPIPSPLPIYVYGEYRLRLNK